MTFGGGQPGRLLCDLYCYFALYHLIDNYIIHINLVTWPVDPVHLQYNFL